MKGRHWITLGSLALTLVAIQQPAFAQNGNAGGGEVREDRSDLRQDQRDIREDRRDIRKDHRDLQGDRRDLRQDVQSGAVRDRSRKIGETFAKAGRIFGKIIGISGMMAKTGVETGETYGTIWLAAKATAVKYLWAREAGNSFGCCRLFYGEIATFRCSG